MTGASIALFERGRIMSDDKTKRGAADRQRIAINEEHEVRYWTKELGVSPTELEEAVKSVGNSADKVREHLRGRRK
jgi:hypothetical protein